MQPRKQAMSWAVPCKIWAGRGLNPRIICVKFWKPWSQSQWSCSLISTHNHPQAHPCWVQTHSTQPVCTKALHPKCKTDFHKLLIPRLFSQSFLIPNGMLGPQKQHLDFVRSFLGAIYFEKDQALTGVQAKAFSHEWDLQKGCELLKQLPYWLCDIMAFPLCAN